MKPVITILADEKNSIPYRPQIAKHFENVACAILLQQILYWWVKNGCKPFFKFKQPCENSLYRAGDSWMEELGFSRREFNAARDVIAAKSNDEKVFSDIGLRYWTDYNRLTWYDVNEDAMSLFLSKIYVKTKTDFTYSPKRSLGKDQNGLYVKTKTDFTYKDTETNSETTQRLPRNEKDFVDNTSPDSSQKPQNQKPQTKKIENEKMPLKASDVFNSTRHCNTQGAELYHAFMTAAQKIYAESYGVPFQPLYGENEIQALRFFSNTKNDLELLLHAYKLFLNSTGHRDAGYYVKWKHALWLFTGSSTITGDGQHWIIKAVDERRRHDRERRAQEREQGLPGKVEITPEDEKMFQEVRDELKKINNKAA